MKRFEYRIYDNVYNDIVTNKKTIEFRLLNEKSKSINIGDEILFKVVDSDNTILVIVLDKYIFNNIDELWDSDKIVNNVLDYNKEEFTNVLSNIYGEKLFNSKIVGIKFKLKDN